MPASALTVDRVIICLCLDCWLCNYLSLQITYFEYLNIEVESNLLTRSNMPARLQISHTDIARTYAQLDRLSMEGNFGRHSVSEHFLNLFVCGTTKMIYCFPLIWHVVYCCCPYQLKDIPCTPFHTSSTSEPKVFHMSSRMEAYLECFVPENKLSDVSGFLALCTSNSLSFKHVIVVQHVSF